MLLSCGDALIDFLPEKLADGRDVLLPMVGGSCFNIAIGMARLGAPTGFAGGISTDLFGQMIARHAEDSQVELRYATRTARPTTLAFARTIDGEARYAFYDEETASRHWTYHKASIPFAAIDAVHIGSTTLVNAHGSAQALTMVKEARGSSTISFDPNCRPSLIHDKAGYVRRMDDLAARADIVRLSDSDFSYLYGCSDYAAKAAALLAGNTRLFIVTHGADGVRAWHRHTGAIKVETPRIDVVDTIGAGDSFQAALLFALRDMGRIGIEALDALTSDELHRALTFATACAASTCSRPGADPPRISEMLGRL